MLMLMVMLGIFFVGSMQPMFMVSSLIFIMLLYSYMLFKMIGSYWFGYALMMVMLSGVLVVFTYMVSLIPNESFENYNLIYLVSMLILMLSGYFMFKYNMKWVIISLNLWMSLISIFNLFMVGFLLSIMLMVVWFSYFKYGALRN